MNEIRYIVDEEWIAMPNALTRETLMQLHKSIYILSGSSVFTKSFVWLVVAGFLEPVAKRGYILGNNKLVCNIKKQSTVESNYTVKTNKNRTSYC